MLDDLMSKYELRTGSDTLSFLLHEQNEPRGWERQV